MIITPLGDYVLEAQVLGDHNVGHKVLILRIPLILSDSRFPFRFQLRQYVAIFRVTNRECLENLVGWDDDDDSRSESIVNVIYKEAFQNLWTTDLLLFF